MRGATVIPSTRSPAISAFQPTRPLRGATRTSKTWKPATRISTHAPLAGRDRDMTPEEIAELISTHAPLAGRDNYATGMTANSIRFQPTRPLRGATRSAEQGGRARAISTHAPLAGRDGYNPRPRQDGRPYFNPRAPCGARHGSTIKRGDGMRFQPTRPLRGATISSHHLSAREVFQPTRPLRGATLEALKDRAVLDISTHAPLAGRDNSACWLVSKSRDFNPRAPCGARPRPLTEYCQPSDFNPRAPCGARLELGRISCT